MQAEPQVDNQTTCYHCGDTCTTEVIQANGKDFCCQGCRTVFELLDENGLCTYYDLESNPGIKIKRSLGDRYAFLDTPEIAESLLEFSEGDVYKVKFYLPSVHCSSCIWLLENLHKLKPGIVHSQVHFLRKEIYLTFRHEEISLRELVELLASIGYEPSINLGSKRSSSKQHNRSFYYKLGIAAFAFGNIMLLSFPEYLDVQDFLEDQYKRLFGYLNLVLALPVFLYSASDYYISAYKGLRARYINIDVPASIGIIALFARSSYEIISGTGAGFMDSFAMFVFLLLVGKWYQNRTYQALSFDRDYRSYFPIAVTRVGTDGQEVSTALDALAVGDVLLVRNQEIIPADSVLDSPEAVIDYSFVTGESDPVTKKKGERIFAGGRQLGPAIRVSVEKPVSQSYLTRLWNQDTFQKEETAMNRLLDRVSRHFTAAVLILAFGSLLVWLPQGTAKAIHVFTSVLIVACPCALALTVPFAAGNAMRLLGKWGFYLKNSDTVEKLSRITTVVFDKTGTLTRKRSKQLTFVGEQPDVALRAWIRSLTKQSAHPISQAIYQGLEGSEETVTWFEEFPGQGIAGEVAGHMLRIGNAAWLGVVSTSEPDHPLATETHLEVDGKYCGYFALQKAYREGIEPVLRNLGEQYELYLLSGDNAAEFKTLRPYFRDDAHLQFRQSPEDKLAFVKQLQSQGKNVVMIGDGLNDAGALKQADTGISLADDIYQFSPACDGILNADRFAGIPDLFRFSKRTLRIVRFSFVLSLTYNLVGMFFALQGLLTPLLAAVLMPLSSITVVGFVSLATHIAGKRILDAKRLVSKANS